MTPRKLRRKRQRRKAWRVLIGILGNDILEVPGYGRENFSRPTSRIGSDERGLHILWFYPDLTIELRAFPWKADPDGPQNAYRIHGVRGAGRPDFLKAAQAHLLQGSD